MPKTSDRNLTLTTVNSDVTVKVTYRAIFSKLERRLAGLGLVYREQISVLGIDPDNGTTGPVLKKFDIQDLPVTDGATEQVISRNRQVTVDRELLQEDPAVGDRDEIRCRIEIIADGLPPAITKAEVTNLGTLLG